MLRFITNVAVISRLNREFIDMIKQDYAINQVPTNIHSIRLEVNENILDKVMYFLNLLPQNDIKIKLENNLTENKPKRLKAVSLKTKDFKFNREEANAR
jgi:hypothetical protein